MMMPMIGLLHRWPRIFGDDFVEAERRLFMLADADAVAGAVHSAR